MLFRRFLMSEQTVQLHSTVLSIHSLDIDADIPAALLKLSLFFISKTHDEFSISTYDTDYILVKKQTALQAITAPRKDGYNVVAE